MLQFEMKLFSIYFFLCFVIIIQSVAGQKFSFKNWFKNKSPSSRLSSATIAAVEMENVAIQNLERIAVMENAIVRNLNNPSRLQSLSALQNLDRIAAMENVHMRNPNIRPRPQPLSALSAVEDSISMHTSNSHPDINAVINSQALPNKLSQNFANLDKNRFVNYGKNTAIALGGIGGILTISKAMQASDSDDSRNNTNINENDEEGIFSTTYKPTVTTAPEVSHRIGNDWD